jgi:orotate phosphoribosyltransferase-like protein
MKKVVDAHNSLEKEIEKHTNKNLEEILNKADLNNDGFITEEEAKQANISPEVATKLNELNQSIKKVKDINQKQEYDFNWNELGIVQDEIKNIKKLSFELGVLQSKTKKDDDTITYF